MNPYWDEFASGIVVGWRGRHTPAHLFRAILEGIAFELRLQKDCVEKATGQKIEQYRVSGGGSTSLLWRQIIADVTGAPICRIQTDQAAALGAGILAGTGLGLEAAADLMARRMVRLEGEEETGSRDQVSQQLPEASRQAVYTEIYERVYRGLYPALKPIFKHLRAH
jgi:sugar (pentulose or hexulose) kinase